MLQNISAGRSVSNQTQSTKCIAPYGSCLAGKLPSSTCGNSELRERLLTKKRNCFQRNFECNILTGITPIGSQILSVDFTQNSADCLREDLCYATIPCEYRSRKRQRLQRINKSVRAELSHLSESWSVKSLAGTFDARGFCFHGDGGKVSGRKSRHAKYFDCRRICSCTSCVNTARFGPAAGTQYSHCYSWPRLEDLSAM